MLLLLYACIARQLFHPTVALVLSRTSACSLGYFAGARSNHLHARLNRTKVNRNSIRRPRVVHFPHGAKTLKIKSRKILAMRSAALFEADNERLVRITKDQQIAWCSDLTQSSLKLKSLFKIDMVSTAGVQQVALAGDPIPDGFLKPDQQMPQQEKS